MQIPVGGTLSDAQFHTARDYGFASWRELKAEVDRRAGPVGPDPVGDWIARAANSRLALHIWREPSGALAGTVDNPDYALFDVPVDGLLLEGSHDDLLASHGLSLRTIAQAVG